MVKTLVARGQATIHIQKDGYTISQSLGEYVFPADADGKIPSAVSVTSTIQVTLGDSDFYGFSIGPVVKPAGFSSISVNNSNKTITYNIAAGTATLADHGTVSIPVIISGATYTLSFVWSKAKSGDRFGRMLGIFVPVQPDKVRQPKFPFHARDFLMCMPYLHIKIFL